MGFGGSSGGSGSLSGSSDVALSNPVNQEVLAYDAASSKWKNAAGAAGAQVVVRWNSTTNQWSARPSSAAFGVLFLSTNDVNATPPTDINLLSGDIWRRHPNAV